MEKEFNYDLLKILVCPKTRTRLRYDAEKHELISDKNLRDLMSVRSREIALNNFSKQKMIISYDAYLQRLIESNN